MVDDCIKKCPIKKIEQNECDCPDHELEKTDDLKSALSALGYKVREEKKGELKIELSE